MVMLGIFLPYLSLFQYGPYIESLNLQAGPLGFAEEFQARLLARVAFETIDPDQLAQLLETIRFYE